MRNPLIFLALAAGLVIGDGLTVLAQTNATASTNATNPFGGRGRRGGPGGQEAARMNGDEFEFRGGSLSMFIRGISQVYGYELSAGIEPSQGLMEIRVPSMKLRTQKVADVLDLYNQIADADPKMGRWVLVYSEADSSSQVRPGGSSPSRPERPPNSVLFVPPKEDKSAESAMEVKAITLRGLSEADRKLLYSAIQDLAQELDRGPGGGRGTLMYNRQTEIVVVKGQPMLVDGVVRMVDAFHEGLAREASKRLKPEEPKSDK